MRRGPALVAFSALAAAAGALLVWLAWPQRMADDDAAVVPPPVASAARPPAAAPRSASTTASTAAMATPRVAALVTGARSAAFQGSDTYRRHVEAWASRAPGGYALAWTIGRYCRDAQAEVRALGAARVNADAARAAAAQELQARCADIGIETQRTAQPQAGDRHGERFVEAWFRALGASSFADQRAALLEFAQQGMLETAWSALLARGDRPAYFEGKPLGGASQAEIFNRALLMAAVAVDYDPTSPSRHLMALGACVRTGACGGTLDDIAVAELPAANEAQRRELLALYPRIATAFASGDVDAFAPPKPRP